MSNLPVPANPLPPQGHDGEYKTAKINSCAQLEALSESEVASPVKALDPTSRHSSPRSIYLWEMSLSRLLGSGFRVEAFPHAVGMHSQ